MGAGCSKTDPYVTQAKPAVEVAGAQDEKSTKRKNIHSTRSVHPSTVQRHALKPRHAVQMSGDDGAGGVPADFRRKAADAVAGGPVVNSADVYVPNIPKSTATMTMLANSVRGSMLFDKLTSDTMQKVFLSMSPLEVLPKTVIIQQGDEEASKFYVLESGTCEVLLTTAAGTSVVHQYKAGSYFGELALLYDQPRAATVQSTAKCKLWVMERAVYNAIHHAEVREVREAKMKLVQSMPIFKPLSETLQGTLCDVLKLQEHAASKALFYKGDEGDLFYIIKSGSVEITVGEKVVSTLGAGQYFGERALWKTNHPRAATAITQTPCTFYTLERSHFQSMLGPLDQIWRFEALQRVPILFNLTDSQLLDIAAQLETRSVAANETVIRQGEVGDSFYIIEEGTFSCYLDDGTKLALVDRGSCFGELALLHNEKRACNVAAERNGGKLLSLARDQFNALLGDLKQLRHTWRFEALRRVPLLQQLSHAARSQLCDIFQQVTFPQKAKIVTQGEPGDAFYIVETGILAVIKDGKPVMRLSPGQYFGELSLLCNEPRAATVVATTDAALLKMSKAEFEANMGPLSKYFADKAKVNYGVAGVKSKQLCLTDLKQVGPLGRGAFGQVSLVKWNNDYCALKQICKQQVVKSQLVGHIKAEKRLMAECDSPFLVRLHAAFQDTTHLYLLMEFVQGGELFTFMRKRRRALRESWARFYAATVIVGFQYLGARHMVYRDLKPENLLIDTKGYLKITDFGFAKKISPGGKTYTLCGTPEYLAPEVILQQGHDRAADWWTLGILIFELVAGMPPFYDKDRVKMFKKTVKGEVKFPSHMSDECSDLIGRLLRLEPTQRLGMQRHGAHDIKDHPWYKGFDWKAFEAQTMAAPYVPVVKSPGDMRNFDAEKAKAPTDTGYKSTGLFTDF